MLVLKMVNVVQKLIMIIPKKFLQRKYVFLNIPNNSKGKKYSLCIYGYCNLNLGGLRSGS